MTLSDLVLISTGNLWRMKLRAFLTISGVLIAIAAFVSMLSFGAGNQEYITRQYNEMGLFSTMQVYPPKTDDNGSDSVKTVRLDETALTALSRIPGVNLAYPLDAFAVTVNIRDTLLTTKAQALPPQAARTKLFSRYLAGTGFSGDSVSEAIVTEQFLRTLDVKETEADSLIGQKLILSVKVASLDSGLTRVVQTVGQSVRREMKGVSVDSMLSRDYWQRLARLEMNHALSGFLDGYLNAQATVSETLTVVGVLRGGREHHVTMEPVIVPVATALHLSSRGLPSSPTELLAAVTSGNFFGAESDSTGQSYPVVTLDLDPGAPYQPIKDTIEAMGYRTFSFAEQFDEIRKFFFYFDLALGVIGLIALVTASLGIVNTMVMSIVERKREIGVLKSLGADERTIRLLFLVESGVIGSAGAVAGIVFGWLITRIVSMIARTIMEKQGIEPMELFALPLWLILTAFFFGLIVSLLAGFYPAARAARVDPVEALRND